MSKKSSYLFEIHSVVIRCKHSDVQISPIKERYWQKRHHAWRENNAERGLTSLEHTHQLIDLQSEKIFLDFCLDCMKIFLPLKRQFYHQIHRRKV